jgi:hypothetical protein
MPNLHCALHESDFDGYDIMQVIIAGCVSRLVKEKETPGHIIIHISFFTVQDKEVFLQKIKKDCRRLHGARSYNTARFYHYSF